MKKCTTCQKTKCESEFNKNNRRKDGLQTTCRPCNKARSKRYYAENKVRHKREIAKNKRIYINRNREFVYNYLLTKSCVDCGEANPIKLDFDHLSNKKSSISAMVAKPASLKSIKQEIEKCMVRCANCHRVKTARDFNWWIYKKHNGL